MKDRIGLSAEPRLFIAIPIPKQVKQQIGESIEQISHEQAFRKWVYPDDLHITVKFLGAVKDERVEQVRQVVRDVAATHTPFMLTLNSLGTFGNPASPRILWLGVEGDRKALNVLQQDVEQAVAPLGFAPENRPYSPHVTLAKHYTGAAPHQLAHRGYEALNRHFPYHVNVDALCVYQTHLGQTPMYEAIETAQFDG